MSVIDATQKLEKFMTSQDPTDPVRQWMIKHYKSFPQLKNFFNDRVRDRWYETITKRFKFTIEELEYATDRMLDEHPDTFPGSHMATIIEIIDDHRRANPKQQTSKFTKECIEHEKQVALSRDRLSQLIDKHQEKIESLTFEAVEKIVGDLFAKRWFEGKRDLAMPDIIESIERGWI